MSASPLEQLQRRFVRSITFLADPELVASVTGGGALTAAAAVDVYRGGYPARLTEALGETYEACWRVLGDDGFFAAAKDYLARTPSLTYNLSDYGESFPEFLEFRPDAEHAPFLGDLARYEWAFKGVFHAAPHVPLDPAVLAAKARPDSVLRLGGATRLLSLRHSVRGIWLRDRSDDTLLEPSDWTGAQRVILYKSGSNGVYSRELTVSEHAALAGLAAGRSLGEALAGADGLEASGAAALFAFISEAGLVVEVA